MYILHVRTCTQNAHARAHTHTHTHKHTYLTGCQHNKCTHGSAENDLSRMYLKEDTGILTEVLYALTVLISDILCTVHQPGQKQYVHTHICIELSKFHCM